jgi:GTPase SAR1 family protein
MYRNKQTLIFHCRKNYIATNVETNCTPSQTTSLQPFHRIKTLIHKKHDERTRGIEISIVENANLTISIWDMVGQEEFHAFHDYMMPNLGDVVNPCSFLFVFNPIMQKNEHGMHHHRKTCKEFHEDLTYWLCFITSNKSTSIAF